MIKKNNQKNQLIFLFLMFSIFFAIDRFWVSSSQDVFDDKRRVVCKKTYNSPIETLELVKSSLVVRLQDGSELIFTVRAPNGNNLSSEFSLVTENGNMFEKTANSDDIIIRQKTGVSSHWKIECPE